MDISQTLAPTSDQLDAVDLLGGPRTFTIAGVKAGNEEQPVQIALAEFPRVWRPGKSMRRVMAAAWGVDAKKWIGERVTLFCDPSVKFGGAEVGGTRISHLSGLSKPLSVPLLVTRGKSAVFRVQPLKDDPPSPNSADVAACSDRAALAAMWRTSGPDLRAVIEARVAALDADAAADAQADGTLGIGGDA